MTDATSGTGIPYPCGAHASTQVFSSVRVTRSLVFLVVFCRSLFVFFPFFFWPLYRLSRFKDCDYPFGNQPNRSTKLTLE
jgi:hypothetical protein